MKALCVPHWVLPVADWWEGLTASRKVLSSALLLMLGSILLPLVPAVAAPAVLPADVPNLYDPAVRARFAPVLVANLRYNPEFPLVPLVNTSGHQPAALLLGLDARNGTDTWSLTGDPIILIVAFAGETIQGLYVDTGFAGQGAASGIYAAVDETNAAALPELLHAVPAAVPRRYI